MKKLLFVLVLFMTMAAAKAQNLNLDKNNVTEKEVLDIAKSLFIFNSQEKMLNIDTSQYPKGVYVINLIENNVIMDTKRILNE